MIALYFLVPYARFGWRSGDDGGTFTEFGALLKYPFVP
jgi:hypothetical protein